MNLFIYGKLSSDFDLETFPAHVHLIKLLMLLMKAAVVDDTHVLVVRAAKKITLRRLRQSCAFNFHSTSWDHLLGPQ